MSIIQHETLQREFKALSGRYNSIQQALIAFDMVLPGQLHFDTSYHGGVVNKLEREDRATVPVVDEFCNIYCVAIIDRVGEFYIVNLSIQI